MSNQSPQKCRFYIDAFLHSRVQGRLNDNQSFNYTGQPHFEPSQEMFNNNPTRTWNDLSSDSVGFGGTDTWTYDTIDTWYYHDMGVKVDYYNEMSNINYIAFLGHNLGLAKTWVEPFMDVYGTDGQKNQTYTRKTLTSTGNNFVVDNNNRNLFKNCTLEDGNKIGFFDLTFDDTDDDDIPDDTTATTKHVGWALARFNDNNNSDDNFESPFKSANADSDGNYSDAPFNTFGIRVYQNEDADEVASINSLSCGWTYVLGKTPDLDIDYSFEFSGVETTEGMKGQSFTNVNYTGPMTWPIVKRKITDGAVESGHSYRDMAAWLHHGSNIGPRTYGPMGRRIWKLKFSYNEASDAQEVNQYNNTLNAGLFGSNAHQFGSHLLWSSMGTSTSKVGWYGLRRDFYSRVIRGTLGGKLPFLFQPNTDNENDIFLCEFDQKSISFTQRAYKVWDFDLTIREVW